MWNVTRSVHYHTLNLEYLCFLTPNSLNLLIDCSACWVKVVFISSLCMCSTCRIGAVLQLVGQEPSACLLGHMLIKVEKP